MMNPFILSVKMSLFLALFVSNEILAQTNVKYLRWKGTVVAGACKVSSESENIKVNMGSLDRKEFKGIGSNSTLKKFNINFYECPQAVNTIMIKFIGESGHIDDYYKLTPSANSATGIALKLVDENHAIQKPNTLYDWSRTDKSLPTYVATFYASYVQIEKRVTVGEANTTITFEIAYK